MTTIAAPNVICETSAGGLRAAPSPHELWHRYHREAEAPVENALIEEYLPLVKAVLGRLAIGLPEHADRDDLHSSGLVGLLQALRNYDPACGTSFETYARTRIRGAMLDQLRRTDWVPRTVHEKARKLQIRIAELEQRCGRLVTEDEIAAELKLSPREYADLLEEIRPATFVCLDAVCGNDGSEGTTYSDLVADPSEDNPFEHTCRTELKEIIFQRLKELPLKQQQVMALYYGEDLNLKEIAAAMNLTESRVCQIHAQAIVSIRAHLQRLESMCNTTANRN